MAEISFRRHRFPPVVIQHAVWLYLRFTLSYRDVEDLLGERGLDMSYETIRSWVLKFGPAIARRLRQRRPRPSNRWHLDEMVVRIAGERRLGHEDPFPRPGPNDRCRVGQETFAGVRGNGRDAPIPDLPDNAIKSRGHPLKAFPGSRPWMVGPAMERTFARISVPDHASSSSSAFASLRSGVSKPSVNQP